MPKDSNTKGFYNTLTFSLDQTQPNDVLYVAASQPYTYSRLVSYLENIVKVAKLNHNIYWRR